MSEKQFCLSCLGENIKTEKGREKGERHIVRKRGRERNNVNYKE